MRRRPATAGPYTVGALLGAALAAGTLAWSCASDDESLSQANALEVYAYDYYYAADVALSDCYWIDDWYLDAFHGAMVEGQAQRYGHASDEAAAPALLEASGAADHGGPVTRPAAALRALAQGRALCPGHVTVVPRMAMTCSLSGGLAPVRSGATITFAGCELEGGGRLDGTVDIAARLRTSDSACDSKTTVSVSYTTSLTDFSYRDRGGAQVLIPSLSDVGSYTRPAAGAPTGLNIRTEGTIQRIDASGAITASHGVRGAGDYTFTAGGTGLASSVEGALAISDRAGGLPVTATGHAVTITSGCCRPTGGSLVLGRSGRAWGAWTFGPACGAMRLDGAPARAADCP